MEPRGMGVSPIKSKNRAKGGPFNMVHNRGNTKTPPMNTETTTVSRTPMRLSDLLSNAALSWPLSPCSACTAKAWSDGLGTYK